MPLLLGLLAAQLVAGQDGKSCDPATGQLTVCAGLGGCVTQNLTAPPFTGGCDAGFSCNTRPVDESLGASWVGEPVDDDEVVEPVAEEEVTEKPVADEEAAEESVESVEEIVSVIDGPIANNEGEPIISEVVVAQGPIANDAVEDTPSFPVKQVASDIRGILTGSETYSDNKPNEVTREEWLAVGPRRRPDGTWRKFPEMA